MADKEKNKEDEQEEQEDQEEEDEEDGGDDEEEAGEEGEEGGKKKKKGKRPGKLKLALLAILVVVIIAVPAVLYLTGMVGGGAEVVHSESEEGDVVVSEDGVPQQSVYYDMEEFVVNLNVGSKRPSFLKMTVSLELGGELQIPRVEQMMPRVRDSFQVYLRELRREDLQGSAGLYRLREELLLRINKIVYPAKVNDILFKEILVQ